MKMSNCPIDHTQQDVIKKLNEQHAFLPDSLATRCGEFLKGPVDQETLNEVFHLLKKYDLATGDERVEREKKMEQLFL